jgi:ribosomal protein S18 acetylase RimI-like enzyme
MEASEQQLEMNGLRFKFLSPEEYYLIEHIFEAENVPPPDPQWSKIIVALTPEGAVAGMICMQLIAHAEPIVVAPGFQGLGLGETLARMMDAYAEELQVAGLYTQPTNAASRGLAQKVGFQPAPFPLYVKIYNQEFSFMTPTKAEEQMAQKVGS